MITGVEKLTPKQIVEELDKYIIGQDKAKKSVAIALRNRMRRQMLVPEMREEIAPKNIIMIGPTGVGKTEIARRLSKLVKAPFVKVEATKYTEVGYVGRDVESMIRDLMSVAVQMVKKELEEDVREEAELRTEDAILDLLLPGVGKKQKKSDGGINLGSIFGSAKEPAAAGFTAGDSAETPNVINLPGPGEDLSDKQAEPEPVSAEASSTREKFRKMLRDGKLEDKEVEVLVTGAPSGGPMDMFSGMNLEDMGINVAAIPMFGGKKKKRKVTVSRARDVLLADELDKLIDQERVNEIARDRTQQMGIVFIDEIDKIAAKQGNSSGDVSREGVQRDILPIVEGSKVNTKFGMVDTSHILFIAAGAFHMSKPSDLIPELQGRFPLRVELEDLTAADFEQILTQPKNALIKQYVALLDTEDVKLDFTPEAIVRMSEIASEVNSKTENIGARRLHTVLELLLEEVSFNAPDLSGQTITVTPEYVDEKLENVKEDQDLSRYIL